MSKQKRDRDSSPQDSLYQPTQDGVQVVVGFVHWGAWASFVLLVLGWLLSLISSLWPGGKGLSHDDLVKVGLWGESTSGIGLVLLLSLPLGTLLVTVVVLLRRHEFGLAAAGCLTIGMVVLGYFVNS
jgi:hypothetical protein